MKSRSLTTALVAMACLPLGFAQFGGGDPTLCYVFPDPVLACAACQNTVCGTCAQTGCDGVSDFCVYRTPTPSPAVAGNYWTQSQERCKKRYNCIHPGGVCDGTVVCDKSVTWVPAGGTRTFNYAGDLCGYQ